MVVECRIYKGFLKSNLSLSVFLGPLLQIISQVCYMHSLDWWNFREKGFSEQEKGESQRRQSRWEIQKSAKVRGA